MPLTKYEAAGIGGGGILNYIAKFTPDGFNVGPSQLFDNGVSVGVGIIVPLAKLHVHQNSVGTGAMGLIVSFPTIGNVLSIEDNADVVVNTNIGLTVRGSNAVLKLVSNGGSNPTLSFMMNNGSFTNGLLYGDNFNMFLQPNKYFGVGSSYFTATASLHVKGEDSLYANYAFRAENSGSPLLEVHNNGTISAPGLQIGNVGLSSGDIYKDSAANILANGDYVIGMKV